jgi:methyl-accepting chemotaxis protein
MKMNIRAKILSGFVAVLVLTAVVAAVGYAATNNLNSSLQTIYLNRLQSVSDIKDVKADLYAMRAADRQTILAQTPADKQAQASQVAALDAALRTSMADFEKLITTQESRDAYNSLQKDYTDFKAVVDAVQAAALKNDGATAIRTLTGGQAPANAVAADVDKLVQINDDMAKQSYQDGAALFVQSRNLLIGALAVAMLLGLGIAFVISRDLAIGIAPVKEALGKIAVGDLNRDMSEQTKTQVRRRTDELGAVGHAITRTVGYLQEMADTATQIAAGNLTVQVEPKCDKDELGRAFADMLGKLRDLVGRIQESSAQVAGASEQLASAAEQSGSATSQVTGTIQQVAQGTATQANSTTEVTSSMEDIARRVEAIARGAEAQANSLRDADQAVDRLQGQIAEASKDGEITAATAEQVARAARASASSVQSTVQGMEAINQSTALVAARVREMGQRSEEIGRIVSTIQDIADQTNLLALNAAIEAARAGEQGRGFAVVADEVRKLAEKSGTSSREIAELVRAVQSGTEEAVRATEEAASNVARGVEEVRGSGQSLEEILSAAQQNSQSTASILAAAARVQELGAQVAESLQHVTGLGEKNLAATREITGSIDQVAQAMENVASVSEENSASAEEVSATAEELAAQVEEVAASAEELSSLAEGLEQTVAHFRLGASTAPILHATASRNLAGQNPVQAQPTRKVVNAKLPGAPVPVTPSGNGHSPVQGKR